MTEKEKLALLEDMLELDEGELQASAVLEDVDEWDSMAKLSLIVMIDDECDKALTADDIKGFVTVQDILDYMG